MTDFDKAHFLSEINLNGFCVRERVIPAPLLLRLKRDLEAAIEKEAAYHAGTDYQDYGMVLLCPLYGDSFLELLALDAFIKPVEAVMGEHCIVYSYTSSSMPPEGSNYSARIHNDCAIHMPSDYLTRFGALITLDDFTEQNGATWVLPGSHHLEEAPSEQAFYEQAVRLKVPAGSVWYAHPKVWHSGSLNRTQLWRHAVTIGFCRAYMKQRLDIPRVLQAQPVELTHCQPRVLQKLGFHAQVPASYNEYYAPPEHRSFRQLAD
ncbi:phytanoyl-CoA dioxygenase family protein [Vampirovibrio sp.]|uniref:phytanoyl-CoA dioxygenase family protein n=1 Tax=Vampirovibrio sp. TaxID=2717857 RepID=UPI003593EC8C